jgi:hypothetical protein
MELALGQNNTCIFKTTEDFIEVFGESNSFEGEPALEFTFFDPLPENIILRNGDINKPCFIDYEWFLDFPLPISILKYRIAQQFSLLPGMDSIIPLDERLNIINCTIPVSKGIIYHHLFSDFVYKNSNLNYSYQELSKNYEKELLPYSYLIDQLDQARTERDRLLNSRSWRITKPLRSIGDFVRRNRVLHLFAKGLLSTKRNGITETAKKITTYKQKQMSLLKPHTLVYESEYQENIDFSNYEPKVKAIVFYLPQFHTIPENDEWWGKGFTEWTNTRKAKPRFKGHYQPREPHKDIGYYDPTNIETIRKQAEIAKQHGIYGFCFYLYWFSGKRLLEKPLDLLLEHPEIDINFCLCWANENWTRRWDGLDQEILIKQNHSKDDPHKFIEDIKKYLVDKRYIRINGDPVILVYRPNLIPNAKETFKTWKKHALEVGIGKIQIWITNINSYTVENPNIVSVIDGEVEFPPNMDIFLKDGFLYKDGFIYNYKEKTSLNKQRIDTNDVRSLPLFRTCMLAWDNAARKKSGWLTFVKFSLRDFFNWASLLVNDAVQSQNKIFFVNAWNEWAEGTYLEPDRKYGYASINTLSKAICGLPFNIDLPIKNI